MKEIEINNVTNLVETLLNTVGRFEEFRLDTNICGGNITRKKVVKTITTTTYTLIEDYQLIKDLVEFCNNRFVLDCRRINEVKVRKLLDHRYNIVNLFKLAESDEDYIYVMDYPDIYNYRWEGDYCPDAEPTIRRYSFSDVLDEFIELHPDKCRWMETVETKIEEE